MRVLNQDEAQLIINQKIELDEICKFSGKSKSQLKQDVFVLSQLGFKRGGYFVEFGATNGVDLSNTYLLEKEFGWDGVVAEPLVSKYSELLGNRSCHVENLCVWSKSGEKLKFNETADSDLSTVLEYSNCDMHSNSRQGGKLYDVLTISLGDLLNKYNAPRIIDYLSIDTEGSEFEILNNFDFDKYAFNVITCEHNFTENRGKIFDLLSGRGYMRVYENLSQFDDWYVKP